jgi:hypothetical protein
MPVARSAAWPSDTGTMASGAGIKPGEPGEALDAADVPRRPSTCRAAAPGPMPVVRSAARLLMPARWRPAQGSSPARRSTASRSMPATWRAPRRAAAQDRCRWRDRPRAPRCRHGGERRQHQREPLDAGTRCLLGEDVTESQLRRGAATFLRKIGIEISFGHEGQAAWLWQRPQGSPSATRSRGLRPLTPPPQPSSAHPCHHGAAARRHDDEKTRVHRGRRRKTARAIGLVHRTARFSQWLYPTEITTSRAAAMHNPCHNRVKNSIADHFTSAEGLPLVSRRGQTR